MNDLITIIVPCFNEQEALPLFYEEIQRTREELGCESELIFIDDGSKDDTAKILRSFSEDKGTHYIEFSRNFGKEAAIYAGLQHAHGDYIAIMDADLQHPPRFLKEMYTVLSSEEGDGEAPDCVAMYRTNRKGEKRIRSFMADRFMKKLNRLSGLEIPKGATDFCMMTRRMAQAVLEVKEYNRFTKGIIKWVGFNTRWLPYENATRCAGKSAWTFTGLIRYGFEAVFSFSTKPLTLAVFFGVVFCVLALLFTVYVVIKTIIWGDPVAGFPSLFCMILFLGGVQLLFLGILGQYVSKMYMETKHRPIYIVRNTSIEERKEDK